MLLLDTPLTPSADVIERFPTDQIYVVPTIHLSAASRDQVRAYVTAAGVAARARFSRIVPYNNETAPLVTEFSARGPDPASGGAVLKPDLSALGQSVFVVLSPKDPTAPRDAAGNAYAVIAAAGTAASSVYVFVVARPRFTGVPAAD
jgi:hypothetical protein